MALSRGVFHPLWQRRHSPVAESGFLGSVRIRRVLTEGEYDFETGQTTGKTYETYYDGEARVQKVARAVRRDFVYDVADNQTFSVQVPLGVLSALPPMDQWMSNIEVEVTECSNPGMVGLVMYLRSFAGSTNDWVTTLIAVANMKDPS